eukprot:CAMPEP_0116102632 /NCGR_PEP_ID=MMETSP0327-20121206/13454_1 /TAXON_ID=44447 /ORGANISM="Pseudo-nitzschia delicatissima, Strain B596" /LENGTH=348 /DNA_ID=CAMNT_0003594687 /DNA_START=201 /DNA_END=1247 /DNA_ORIENTATION=+
MEVEKDQVDRQGNSDESKESQPENESSSVVSNNSMDSGSSSLASSPKGQSQVSELVAKSKKAASSLWTLLHAKNCRLGGDRCSHSGCPEAKMMYLHHKTCSAKGVEPCPTNHKGCQDARKLLAHFRRCRDIRARQSQMLNGKNRQQHVCLVCSLVARHAKFTLDKCVSASSKNGKSSTYIPSLNLSNDAYQGKRCRSQSFATYSSSSAQEPRFAFSRRPSNGGNGAKGFQALQAAVSCALNSNPKVGAEKPVSRPRAESLDVTRYQKQQQEKNKEEKSMDYLYLAAVDNFSEDIKEEETPQKTNSTVRRRSLSCTVPSRKQTPSGGGSTLLQNTTIAEDLQYILGNSS